jgi:SAM-dependent methyltransferase
LGLAYTQWICRREYFSQKYSGINERAVEISFVFKKLTLLWPKTVLDVGTGATSLPHMIRNCGFLVTAIDNIRDYWPFGMINRHYCVLNDDITDSRLEKTFDFITCISVLEHIEEHGAAIKNIFKLLNPGGHAILTFPYNETNYIKNVYDIPGSDAKEEYPFITQVFSRNELDKWLKDNSGIIIDQEYWQFYEGDFWTLGGMIERPIPVTRNQLHHITCLLIQKTR